MIDKKWSLENWPLLSDKEKKTLEHSVPWKPAIGELYKTYSKKEIYNLMETGELSYAVSLHRLDKNEDKPHGLDALSVYYGSDRLEDFLRDYDVWFYRDSLSDVLRGKEEGNYDSDPEIEVRENGDALMPQEPTRSSSKMSSPHPTKNRDTSILQCGKEAELLYEFMKSEIKAEGETLTMAGKRSLHRAALTGYKKNSKTFSRLKIADIDNEDYFADCEQQKRQIVGGILHATLKSDGYNVTNYQKIYKKYQELKRGLNTTI